MKNSRIILSSLLFLASGSSDVEAKLPPKFTGAAEPKESTGTLNLKKAAPVVAVKDEQPETKTIKSMGPLTLHTSTLKLWNNPEERKKATMLDIYVGDDDEGYRKQKLNPEDFDDGTNIYRLVKRTKTEGKRRRQRDLMLKKVIPSDIALISPEDSTLVDKEIIKFQIASSTTSDLTIVLESPSGKVTEVKVDANSIDEESGYYTEFLGGFLNTAGTWKWYTTMTQVSSGIKQTSTIRTFNVKSTKIETRKGVETFTSESMTTEAPWTKDGKVRGAVGRLYFEFPDGKYECSGTTVYDNKSGRSLILTAAHCIYDDITGAFATNVLFIPEDNVQKGNAAADYNCNDDPCGCWSPTGGVVHEEWKNIEFPKNLAYDVGFYVVDNVGKHSGPECQGTEALDEAIEELHMDVTGSNIRQILYGFGFSEDSDPPLRYCVDMAETRKVADEELLFMPNCALMDGTSGGPWIRSMDESTGDGAVVGVNSWSYVSSGGMGGPILEESPTRCLANMARSVDMSDLSLNDGMITNCYNRPCSQVYAIKGHARLLRGSKTVPCPCGGKVVMH